MPLYACDVDGRWIVQPGREGTHCDFDRRRESELPSCSSCGTMVGRHSHIVRDRKTHPPIAVVNRSDENVEPNMSEHIEPSTPYEIGGSSLDLVNGVFYAAVKGGGVAGPGVVLYFESCCGRDGNAVWQRLRAKEDCRSRSGRSGTVIYDVRKPGLYYAKNFGIASQDTGSLAFRINGDGTAEAFDTDAELTAAMRSADPEGAARAAELAYERQRQVEIEHDARIQRLEDAAQAYRDRPAITFQLNHPAASPCNALVAVVAQPFTDRGEPLAEGSKTARLLVVTPGGASRKSGHRTTGADVYVIPDPTSDDTVLGLRIEPGCRGDEEAAAERLFLVRDGDYTEVDRPLFEETVRAARGDDLLPELTGSAKQIAWAEDIRARVKAVDPKYPALKRATRAKYWIDNRRDMPG